MSCDKTIRESIALSRYLQINQIVLAPAPGKHSGKGRQKLLVTENLLALSRNACPLCYTSTISESYNKRDLRLSRYKRDLRLSINTYFMEHFYPVTASLIGQIVVKTLVFPGPQGQ